MYGVTIRTKSKFDQKEKKPIKMLKIMHGTHPVTRQTIYEMEFDQAFVEKISSPVALIKNHTSGFPVEWKHKDKYANWGLDAFYVVEYQTVPEGILKEFSDLYPNTPLTSFKHIQQLKDTLIKSRFNKHYQDNFAKNYNNLVFLEPIRNQRGQHPPPIENYIAHSIFPSMLDLSLEMQIEDCWQREIHCDTYK